MQESSTSMDVSIKDKDMDNPIWPDIDKLLTTLASDLEVMLSDLHQNGNPAPGDSMIGCGETKLLQQYMQYGPLDDEEDDEEEGEGATEENPETQMLRRPLGSEGDEEEEEDDEDMSCNGSRHSVHRCVEAIYDNQHSEFLHTTTSREEGGGGGGSGGYSLERRVGYSVERRPPPGSHITTHEQLTRTQNIWYLPSLSRDLANIFLHRQNEGVFVVRHSSKFNEDGSMALSIRAPRDQVDHYIVEANRGAGSGRRTFLQLQRSQHQFSDLLTLVLHYFHDINEELPCRLSLPVAILQAHSAQQLQAVAMLGQEFWTHPSSQQKCEKSRDRQSAVSPYMTSQALHSISGHDQRNPSSSATCSSTSPSSCPHRQTETVSFQHASSSALTSKVSQRTSSLHLQQQHPQSRLSSSLSPSHRQVPPPTTSNSNGRRSMRGERQRGGGTDPLTAKKTTCAINSTNVTTHGTTRSLENGVVRRETVSVVAATVAGASASEAGGVVHNSNSTSSSYHQKPKRSLPPPPLQIDNGLESGFAMLDDALESFKEKMSSPSSKLHHSGDRSAFSKPSPPDDATQSQRYYCSSPHDKLSDYEDVWSPKPSNNTPQNFFKPIEKGSSVSSLDSLMPKESDRMSMHNPGYISDTGSDKDFIDQTFVVDYTKQPLCSSTPNTERPASKKSRSKPVVRNKTVHDINYERKASRKVVVEKTVSSSSASHVLLAGGSTVQSSSSHVSSSKTECVRRTSVKSQSVPRDIAPNRVEVKVEQDYENLVNGVPLMPNYSPSGSAPMQRSRPSGKDSAPCLATSTIADPPVHEVKSDPVLNAPCVIPLSQYILPTQSQNQLRAFQAAPTLPLHCPRAQSLPTEDLSPEPPPVPPKNLATPPPSPVVCKPPPHPSNGMAPSPSPPNIRKGMPLTSDSFEKNFELMCKLEEPGQMHRFPLELSHHPTPTQGTSQRTSYSESSTVEDLINDELPSLAVKPIRVEKLTEKTLQRISDYDNVNGVMGAQSRRTVASSATTYCVPWDNIIQQIMDNPPPEAPPVLASLVNNSPHQHSFLPTNQTPPPFPLNTQAPPLSRPPKTEDEDDDYSSVSAYDESGCPSECATSTFDSCSQKKPGGGAGENEAVPEMDRLADKNDVSDDEGMEDDQGMNPLLAPHLWSLQNYNNHSGVNVRRFVCGLAKNKQTEFGNLVQNFIECTKNGTETNPQVVVRNVRQFMSGIKNFLVQKGEAELQALIDMERQKLGANEFLNIDAFIEGALHMCVVKPLKQHMYKLFVAEYKRTGELEELSKNIKYARTKSAQDLGVKCGLLPPGGGALEAIRHYLDKMQKAYSPLNKLEYLLGATSALTNSVQSSDAVSASSHDTSLSIGADDFLPMFIYVLVQCGMVSAEIEAEYMWGLLHPCLLTGNGGYYLTTLSSAVHVLKQLRQTMENGEAQTFPSLGDLQGFMNIMIPNETNDSIITKVLPVRPNMTTKDVCTMIAHKINVTNPQDYGLYVITMDLETRLNEQDSPHAIKTNLQDNNRSCAFSYHRINAKFAWPVRR